ncbi:hypothetical protein [Williamwhitmania taraxaci]|uniref:Uncharacterized protein n=1 Tax=Williamwhitmania taraxaci TaxID=1640674 RepID=A0A1G6NCQ7_9BACT|nr:hypothetical protein [Williamwhitmania taraxaci]SDC65106.1 hypothetical protein SAMN05216323_10422 [Williamwhitmania taraxaci]
MAQWRNLRRNGWRNFDRNNSLNAPKKVAQLRPKRLAQLEPKWVAQLRPFYLGVISTEPRYNGRLRSNVETKLPYWLKIQNDGLHFIEFSIPIDLCMYDKSIFKKDGIINWTDKRFYFVKE